MDMTLDDKINEANNIIKESINRFKRVGIGLSGGSDSVVVTVLALPYKWDIPVIFIDTHYQFPETYDYIEDLKDRWDLNLSIFRSKRSRYNWYKNKYKDDPKKFYYECCIYHKVKPMMRAIKELELEAFIVGIRGVEHEERAKEVPISFKSEYDPPHYRIHPLLNWSRDDIIDFMTLYNIPVNPMYEKGYTSLGCSYCTKPNVDPNAHERAGRAKERELIKKYLKEQGYN